VLDGFLVPFCSKCLDACMRANNALSGFGKEQVRELTAQARTVRSMCADGPLLLQKVWWKSYVADGPAYMGGRSTTLTIFIPVRVFSGQACGLVRGWSAAGARTVRRLFDKLNQKYCYLCLFF
jgi:hypothetical protein